MNLERPIARRVMRDLARVGMVASAVMLLLSAAPLMTGARAAATNGGAATVTTPNSGTGGGQPLASGTKTTAFSLKLPNGAACTGDSANDGYRVQSYHVPSTVDPASLTYDATGPIPNGVGASFRQPLYQTNSSPYVDAQTAPASPAPGPGPVVNIPAFDYSQYDATTLPAGTYNIGIACTKGAASATQLDKYWNAPVTIAADGSWTAAAPSGGTTTSTTVAGATTTTISGATTTTTTAGGATTTTVAGGTATTTPTTRPATTTPTTNSSAAVSNNTLARTGRNLMPLLGWAAVLLIFGRFTVLFGRPLKAKGSHFQ
ncbi:MAG: hypothetical protein H0U92_04980 [Actinobacteria bacterium]|nr:hypothetical protein [Actinomycetota bacterium]